MKNGTKIRAVCPRTETRDVFELSVFLYENAMKNILTHTKYRFLF